MKFVVEPSGNSNKIPRLKSNCVKGHFVKREAPITVVRQREGSKNANGIPDKIAFRWLCIWFLCCKEGWIQEIRMAGRLTLGNQPFLEHSRCRDLSQ